jgi:hypothetical protein
MEREGRRAISLLRAKVPELKNICEVKKWAISEPTTYELAEAVLLALLVRIQN